MNPEPTESWRSLREAVLIRDSHYWQAKARAGERALDLYDDALDALRPLMEEDPLITVAQAARLLAAQS